MGATRGAPKRICLDYGPEFRDGRIFRLSPDGAECQRVKIPRGLVDPYQFARHADGSIWIVDKNADPRGLMKEPGETGTLWRLSADFETLSVICTGPPLIAPAGIVFAGDQAFLMDADAFQIKPHVVKPVANEILEHLGV